MDYDLMFRKLFWSANAPKRLELIGWFLPDFSFVKDIPNQKEFEREAL